MLLAQVRYGFYGIHGFFGLLLGLVLMMVVLWALWTIFDIIAAKFSTPEMGWMFQILRVVLIVVTVIYFVNAMFNIFPF
jgi:hypothetical protein